MGVNFRTGNPIWVYYTDVDTDINLRVPTLLKGMSGEQYAVHQLDIPHYKFFKATGPLTGTFDDRQKTVHLYYRKQTWPKIKDVNLYLQTMAPTTLFDQVDGMPVESPMPAGLFLRAFQLIETTNHVLWYQINADRWVKEGDHLRVLAHDPYADEPSPVRANLESDFTYLKLNHLPVTVDFVPNGKVAVYDQAYGTEIGQVADGQKLILTGKIMDDNGVVWYEAVDHGYINGSYLKLEED